MNRDQRSERIFRKADKIHHEKEQDTGSDDGGKRGAPADGLRRYLPVRQMRAVVNRIIPFSSVDGPGNRTAVFLQGCNIDCRYCHNPETRGFCQNCGVCADSCPAGALSMADGKVRYNAAKCVQCDTCIHVCPHDSSPRTEELSPEEVEERVRRQIPFIRGISVSGGECMLQPAFLTELFRLAKADGLTTLIDSNGTVPFWEYPELMKVTDGVMLDIKAFDCGEHRKVTGASNEIVLANASWLAEHGKLYEVRAVIVPGLYDGERSIRSMGAFLAPYLAVREFRIKIIAYRPMGVRREYACYEVPRPEELEHLADILRECGFQNIIII